MSLHYRQGDILLIEVRTIPDTAVAEENIGGFVIAYGEQTGHKHVIRGKSLKIVRNTDDLFLDARSLAVLSHDEHAPINVRPGKYRVVQQRQYTGRVADADRERLAQEASNNVDPMWEYAYD